MMLTWFDWTVVVVVGLSALLGLWHGFIREVLALVGWIAAAICAALFAPAVAPLLPAAVPGPGLRLVLAVIILFVGVRIAIGLISLLITRLARAAGMGLGDRLIGGVFGVARGIVLLVIGVLIAGLTSLPQDPGWRGATFSRPLVALALAAKPYLPSELAARVQLEEIDASQRRS
jgi:membrane protein required for colicin V production